MPLEYEDRAYEVSDESFYLLKKTQIYAWHVIYLAFSQIHTNSIAVLIISKACVCLLHLKIGL